MFSEDLRENLSQVLNPGAFRTGDYQKSGCLLEIRAAAGQMEAVARVIRDAGLFLESITAVDFTNGLQLIYHFNSFYKFGRVQVRVQLTGDEAVPTISLHYDSALWHEREVFDLFGIHFDNHPDLRRILLPEEADFHPLRKEFGKVKAFRSTEETYGDPDD